MTSLKNMCLGVALLVLGSTSVWAAPLNGAFTFGQTGLGFSPSINNGPYNTYSGTASWNSTLGTPTDDFIPHAGDFTPTSTQSLLMDGRTSLATTSRSLGTSTVSGSSPACLPASRSIH